MFENRYIPAPFFFLRAPLWPSEDIEFIFAQGDWKENIINIYDNRPLLREAIAIASPSLHQSLQQRPLKDPQQTATSLLHYAIRMATRATPFGLFSFVATGSWGSQTHISIDTEKVFKKARPDMEWVFNFAHKLYEDPQLFSSLPVYTNPLAKLIEDRYCLDYIREAEKKSNGPAKTISIRASTLVKTIAQLASKPITIHELWESIERIMPQLDRRKTENVIQALLQQQLLLPGILPSLLSMTPFEDFSDQLPDPISLEKFAKNIEIYNQLKLGEGIDLLQHLQQQMQETAPAKTFLQVDATYKCPDLQITKSIADELQKSLSFCSKVFTRLSLSSPLKEFHAKFLEKYGTFRTVPLMELLDENIGLGPVDPPESLPRQSAQFSNLWDNWLNSEWQKCLYEQKTEIVLDEKVLDSLISLANDSTFDIQYSISSLDVFCKIITESSQALDQGEFLIYLTQCNSQGGSTLGRFLHLLDEKIVDELEEFLTKEEQLEPRTRFMELSYWPSSIRSANVAIQPCLRTYRLDIEEKKKNERSISLSDIYVGATINRFYLTSKEGAYEIVPRVGNLLNPQYAPAPLRFMRDVAMSRHHFFYPFSWGKLATNSAYLPRIRFQKTLLAAAQWNFDIVQTAHIKKEELLAYFKKWAEQWKLPERCFLIRGDQHLLLDLRHPACLKEIEHKLKKGESLQFIEEIDKAWIKSEKGHHFAEIVVPFIKNPSLTFNHPLVAYPYFSVPIEERWKFLGSEWLYIKAYRPREGMDRFIVQQLSLLVDQLSLEEPSWFFVRYSDPEPHLRLRLRIPSVQSDVITVLKNMTKEWMEAGLIKNVILASYEREVERYGGLSLINAAEDIFCADSKAVSLLLCALLNKDIDTPVPILYALSVLSFLNDLNLSLEDKILVLSYHPADQKELTGFREHKNALLQIANALKSDFPEHAEASVLKAGSQIRQSAISKFQSQSMLLPKKTSIEIYRSLIHMHCNRLGCDSKAEKRAGLYARQILISNQKKESHKAIGIGALRE